MAMKEFQPISFAAYYLGGDPEITIEVTKFSTSGKPLSWAVLKRGAALSNKSLFFTFQPSPSLRTDEWFEEFRVSTFHKAKALFKRWQKAEARRQKVVDKAAARN